MKLKYYLRGLGIGIMFTAVILAIIHSYETTDSKIIERAKKLGMVMQDESQSNEKDTTLNASAEGNSTKEETKEPVTDETKPTESTANKVDETSATEAETETETETEDSGQEVTIIIESGMTGEIVSRMLMELGVISDAADFNNFLNVGGYAYNIKVGTFTLMKGSSYEQIVQIITIY